MVHDNDKLHLNFNNTTAESQTSGDCCCNVLIHVFDVGDLKTYDQMLGRENMCLSWCMWCLLLLKEWKLSASNSDTHGIPAAH